ncbi:MAG: CapA family protein, partial [Chloroflexi bacterium]|nr:CapA family protein [Chloroflexota bacterium]
LALYPLDLGYGRPRAQRGRPLLADAEMGQQILARIARLSAELGTNVELRDGRGVVAGL